MRCISTRSIKKTNFNGQANKTKAELYNKDAAGRASSISFSEAVFRGLAGDGGLFVPEEFSPLSSIFREIRSDSSFLEIACKVLGAVLSKECSTTDITAICESAFTHEGKVFAPEIKSIESKLKVLELFHGPSAAFKDYGAQFLAAYLEHTLQRSNDELCILTATSGDTGAAVAQAFYKREGIRVFVLYPSGRVSLLQERQFATLGENVCALEVDGSFDDCQRLVKDCFLDANFSLAQNLSSANSINIGRLLPQALYYIYAWIRADRDPHLQFVVPSGNFGNLCAGLYAQQWGMNVRPFIAATNSNTVVPEYLDTGQFKTRDSQQTLATAMDVGNPSNFERILSLFGTHAAFATHVLACGVDDSRISHTIKHYYDTQSYLVCPHTATGLHAAHVMDRQDTLTQRMVLATAHPAKFNETVQKSCGHEPALPRQLDKLLQKQIRSQKISNKLAELQAHIRSSI